MPKPVIIEVAGEPRGIVPLLAIGYRIVAVQAYLQSDRMGRYAAAG